MNLRAAAMIAALVFAGGSYAAAAQSGERQAGVVNGEIITEQQVRDAAAAVARRRTTAAPATEREALEAMHHALDAIAAEKMIAAEASKLQTTPQQILEAEVESNVETPSDAQVEAYYERNRARFTAPRAQALRQARQQLVELSRNRYFDALLRRLKREYGFKSFLEPLRTEVATAGHPARGPADAPVTIVEFSDFECPFCGALFPTLKALEQTHAKTVRLVYRHFPLTNIHPYAQKAAEASLCAHDQGRFWEMHDSLFGFQQDLTVKSLKLRARELNLDTAAFDACLDSGEQAARVKADMADAAKAGVTGTPTLFVNGRILLGNQPAELRALIEDELRRAGR
jgi:predicted DsbA family dithiol-disulfide isomerase